MTRSRRSFLAILPSAAPTPGALPVSFGKATLSFADFPALESVGGGVVVATSTGDPLAVVRTGASTATALSAICTHEGCYVAYNGPTGFACPCHGATCSISGVVTGGPAPRDLARYPATVDGTGISVTGL